MMCYNIALGIFLSLLFTIYGIYCQLQKHFSTYLRLGLLTTTHKHVLFASLSNLPLTATLFLLGYLKAVFEFLFDFFHQFRCLSVMYIFKVGEASLGHSKHVTLRHILYVPVLNQ